MKQSVGPDRRPKGRWQALWPAAVLAIVVAALVSSRPASAAKAIVLDNDQDRVEITALGQLYEGRGDSFQVEVVGAEGVQARMAVRASVPGTSPRWLVFALTNSTDKAMERLLTSERYALVGSGVVWPDLDSRRIEAVTPSLGFLPERLKNERADIFRITLEPGQTITYAAELATDRVPRIYLWKPLPYEIKARDRQLFNGIMLGIVGVLGIFLTSIFAANHKGIFPAAALVAWCLLAYLCVDFGFFHKLFNLRAEDNAIYRATTESAFAASLVIFLTTFLRAHAWPALVRMLAILWITGHLALVAVAVIDPRLAATFARASFLSTGTIGSALILFFFIRGQDRALALIPTWILFLVFIYGANVTLAGRLGGDIVVSSFVASLVLLAVLIGFTVTQFAFRPGDIDFAGPASDGSMSSLAIEQSRAAIWEWRTKSGEIKVGPSVEGRLGLMIGELSGKVDTFVRHMHAADRDKFMLQLWSAQERGRGVLNLDFRMRHADNSYVWFNIEASSIESDEERDLRCIGLMRDVNEQRRSLEQLLHDAVHDSRTGLPNRALLIDRTAVALLQARANPGHAIVVMVLGIDKFSEHNARFGRTVGDTLLQSAARRVQRVLRPQDTLARIGGDQFGILLQSIDQHNEVSLLAERVRTTIQAPTNVAGEEVVLTGSLGIAISSPGDSDAAQLLTSAEVAMHRAKRDGANRFEIYSSDTMLETGTQVPTAEELRTAIDKGQITLEYQPIIYLPSEELVGFEALVRWEHPRLGLLMPDEFIGLAESHDLVHRLGSHVLDRSAEEATRWRSEFPRADKPLFLSVNVSSQQLFRPGIVADVKRAISRHAFEPGQLRLEITETLVMENPEQAAEILAHLKAAGAGLAMDDFGTGYSSLAYLQRFPFDIIKIDRSLVQKNSTDAAGAAIVRSIVALAHELGRKVVAEGIEDDKDAVLLRAIGCDYAQGFHFGAPMSAKDTIAYLKFVRKTEYKLQKRGLVKGRGAPRLIEDATATKTLRGVLARARTKPERKSGEKQRERPAAASAPATGNGAARPPAQTVTTTGVAPPIAMAASGQPATSSAAAVFPPQPLPPAAVWPQSTGQGVQSALASAMTPQGGQHERLHWEASASPGADNGAFQPPGLIPSRATFTASHLPSRAFEAPRPASLADALAGGTLGGANASGAVGPMPPGPMAPQQAAPPEHPIMPPLSHAPDRPHPGDLLPPLTSLPITSMPAVPSAQGPHPTSPLAQPGAGSGPATLTERREPAPSLLTHLRPVPRPRANLSNLPPRMAQSLARLAGDLDTANRLAQGSDLQGDQANPTHPRAAE